MQTFRLGDDGRLRWSENITGTVSWRFTSGKRIDRRGLNAKTIPRSIRVTYISDPNRIFVQRDLSQAEARVVAYYAECLRQISKMADPSFSLHKELGREIFGYIPAKDTPEYTAAKGGVHGGNFREGAVTLARRTKVPVATCRAALEGYHSLYPEIRSGYHDWVKHEVLTKGCLINPLGFRCVMLDELGKVALTGVFGTDEWNFACSFLPQSTVPMITNTAILDTLEAFPEAWLHHQGYDSALFSIPDELDWQREFCETTKHLWEIPVTIKNRQLIIPSECTIGYSWGLMRVWDGNPMSKQDWLKWVEGERVVGRGDSKEAILKGTFGVL